MEGTMGARKSVVIVHTLFFALLFAWLGVIDVAMAQEIEFPHGYPPEAPLQDVAGGTMLVVTLKPDASFLSSPDIFGEPMPDRPGFLELGTAYAKTADEKNFLVKVKKNENWGWMKHDEIQISSICMTSPNKNNPAFLKVVAKNNWRLKEGIIEQVPIRNGPGQNYKVVGKINIYKIRYAFKKVKGNDEKDYVLVGNDPTWDEDYAGKILKGWILRDHCILWDNQVGVYFDKSTSHKRDPVLVFETLKDVMNFKNEKTKNNVVGEEERAFARNLSSDTTRFPILDHSKDMMQIAWVGDAIQGGGAPPTPSLSREPPQATENTPDASLVQREKLDEIRGEINRFIDSTRTVDVLILIDSTRSMDIAFKPVANGIVNFIEYKNRKNEKSRFRFAFGVYRDYVDEKTGKDFELLSDFDQADIKQIIYGAVGGADSDPRDGTLSEAIFNGVKKGVDKVSWGPDHIHAVVVVGDHQSLENTKKGDTIEGVVKLLQENNISFYSINVEHKKSAASYCEGFRAQMKTILSLNNDNGRNASIKVKEKEDFKKITAETDNFLRDALVFSSQVSNSIRAITEGTQTIADTRRKYGIRVTQYVLKLMRDHGWEEKDIRLADFNQFCSDGWVSKKSSSGENQIVPYCLISRSKFDNLVGLLASIYSRTSKDPNKNIDRLIKSACEFATGDKILDGETLSIYIQRIFHIPFREISGVLQFTPEELKVKMELEKDFRKKFNKEIGYKWEKLHYVAENKEGEPEWSDANGRWKPAEGKKKEWWFTTATGLRFCWLPFEFLP